MVQRRRRSVEPQDHSRCRPRGCSQPEGHPDGGNHGKVRKHQEAELRCRARSSHGVRTYRVNEKTAELRTWGEEGEGGREPAKHTADRRERETERQRETEAETERQKKINDEKKRKPANRNIVFVTT